MIDLVKSNLTLIFLSVIVLACGATLMLVSQEVYQTQKHVKALEKEKQMTEWEIRALNGEIAFLTRPDRLDKLSTVMAQSIAPASGHALVISPVHFSMMENPAILPGRKPATPRHSSVQNSPSPTVQKTPQQDFSTLLTTIGGGG